MHTLYRWEKGDTRPPRELMLRRLASATGIPLEALTDDSVHITCDGGKPVISRKGDRLSEARHILENPIPRGLPRKPVPVRLKGQVPAGGSTIVWEVDSRKDYLMDPDLWEEGHRYGAVRVKGDSMEGLHIPPGAVVIYDVDREPRPGDIVIAYLGPQEDEATLKRICISQESPDLAVLQPANHHHDPIVLRRDQVKIRGVAVQIIIYPGRS